MTQPEINITRIPMIRSLRNLTRLLGRLGFKTCVVNNDTVYSFVPAGFVKPRPPWLTGMSYGWGLRETQDWVDNYLDKRKDNG